MVVFIEGGSFNMVEVVEGMGQEGSSMVCCLNGKWDS